LIVSTSRPTDARITNHIDHALGCVVTILAIQKADDTRERRRKHSRSVGAALQPQYLLLLR